MIETDTATIAEYAVINERIEANWAAYVPDLPGCMASGKTLEEVKLNIRETNEGHSETLRQFGDPIPEPSSVAGEVEVRPAACLEGWRDTVRMVHGRLAGPAESTQDAGKSS